VTVDCSIESLLWRHGLTRIAGLDEAGRGAWAGPVVASAVILPPEPAVVSAMLEPSGRFPGLRDSKQLSRAQREVASEVIRDRAMDFGVGIVPVGVIDEFGISCAGQLAFWRAVDSLKSPPEFVLVDGFPLWSSRYRQLSVIGGDACTASIAAASIIAKVTRDALMAELDRTVPGYAFAQNCGYGTQAHRHALVGLGPSPQHRVSYRPVASARRADHA
jgi:ribonuclease HII